MFQDICSILKDNTKISSALFKQFVETTYTADAHEAHVKTTVFRITNVCRMLQFMFLCVFAMQLVLFLTVYK